MTQVTSDVQTFLRNVYDVIIIGGGTAGLALASRLSECENLRIGVLEAGPDKSTDPTLTSGGSWARAYLDVQNHWGFTSSVQENLTENAKAGRVLTLPRGKLLGGSSAINATIWMRGAKAEYDSLETIFGNPGWNFESLLPYFQKSQSHTAQPSALFPDSKVLPVWHGTDGPVKTSQNWWLSPLIAPLVKTILSLHFNVNSNPDDGDPLGLINVSRSVHPETSRRQDAVATYLKAASSRSNLCILTGAQVRKIIFAEGSGDLVATSVDFQVGEERYVVKAEKEIVLSAGAYQTPQLLELSGIGDRFILGQHNIETKIELPVGENLQDHMMVYLEYKVRDEMALKDAQSHDQRPLLPSGFTLECVGTEGQENDPKRAPSESVTGNPFLVSHLSSFSTDNEPTDEVNKCISILDRELASKPMTPLTRAQYQLHRHWLATPGENVAEGVLMFACIPGFAGVPTGDGGLGLWLPLTHLRPASRGSVHIASSDPLDAPNIDLRCLNEYDLQALIRMIRFGDSLTRREPLASIIVPKPALTDEECEKLIRNTASVTFHPVGTAPMASRELGGVVDHNLKVYGTTNLRVVDASVFPLQISTMPQATIYAFAEKAADIIKSVIAA